MTAFQAGFAEGADQSRGRALQSRSLDIQEGTALNQQREQLRKGTVEGIKGSMDLIRQTIESADLAGISRDDPGVQRAVTAAAEQAQVLAQQAQGLGLIPGLTPQAIQTQVANFLRAPTPEQAREASSLDAQAVARGKAAGTLEAQPQLVDVLDDQGNVIAQQDPTTGRRLSDPTAPDLLSPEEEAQQIRIASRVAAAQAAASPANSLIRVMQEERLAQVRLKNEEAEQRIAGRKKEQEADEKRVLRMQKATEASSNRQLKFVDKAINLVENNAGVAGFFGEKLKDIGGTDARALREIITTLQARIAFDELNAMRQASATGGALGQVAIREIELLQATLGSLDQGQPPEVLLERLRDIQTHYTNIRALIGSDSETQVIQNPETGEIRILRDGQWQQVAQ